VYLHKLIGRRVLRWLCIREVDTAAPYKITTGESDEKKRRSWTTEDIRTLKTLARQKTRAGKIAKKLKRTESATRQKAFSMGVSLDARM
jgi:hypothetical protein